VIFCQLLQDKSFFYLSRDNYVAFAQKWNSKLFATMDASGALRAASPAPERPIILIAPHPPAVAAFVDGITGLVVATIGVGTFPESHNWKEELCCI
jgi:hypothetical protein